MKKISSFSSLQSKAKALGFILEGDGMPIPDELKVSPGYRTISIQNPKYPRKRIYIKDFSGGRDLVSNAHDTLDHMLYAKNLLAD